MMLMYAKLYKNTLLACCKFCYDDFSEMINKMLCVDTDYYDRSCTIADSGSSRDFGTTKAAKMYFSMSDPGPNVFAVNNVTAPSFSK